MNILVTGGSGYIGSHTLIALNEAGYEFIVYDNLSNSLYEAIKRVSKIIGKYIIFEKGDIRDKKRLQEVFMKYDIDSVIHFAGLKSVSESVAKPLAYYDNNVNGTIVLLEVMKEYNCRKMVFSSSATVYNEVNTNSYKPIKENNLIGKTTNPYGTSKYIVERILKDIYLSDNSWKIVILRYFNPVGAHESGTIGEDPNGIPSNLMPFITQVSIGKRKYLNIFGDDYDTKDGTGVRDYIHITDLADAHVMSLSYINSKSFNSEKSIFNIGTGHGYSVFDIIKAYEKLNNVCIPFQITHRREGDIAKCYANPNLAEEVLNWRATKTLEEMCKDSYRWQNKNPNGYKN